MMDIRKIYWRRSGNPCSYTASKMGRGNEKRSEKERESGAVVSFVPFGDAASLECS